MTDIREDIVSAYMTRLQTITTGNGYRTTIDTVERGYRDPSEVGASERPYIGVVPGRESYQDEPGRVVTMWSIALACYLTASAATPAAVIASLSNLAADIRKALYASPENLSVDQMIFARVVSREGNEGLVEAAKTKNATMVIGTVAKFWEDATG